MSKGCRAAWECGGVRRMQRRQRHPAGHIRDYFVFRLLGRKQVQWTLLVPEKTYLTCTYHMHLWLANTVLFGVAKKHSIPPTPFDSIDFNRPYTKPANALLHTPPWCNQDGGPRVRIVIEVSTCGSVTLLAPSFPRTIQDFKACLSFNSATSRNAVILVRKSSLCGKACLWTFAYRLLHDLF